MMMSVQWGWTGEEEDERSNEMKQNNRMPGDNQGNGEGLC